MKKIWIGIFNEKNKQLQQNIMNRISIILKQMAKKGHSLLPCIRNQFKTISMQIFNSIGFSLDPINILPQRTDSSFLTICFIDNYLSQMNFLLKKRKYKNIIVAGNVPFAKKIFNFLRNNSDIKVTFIENINNLACIRNNISNDPTRERNNFDSIFLFCTKGSSKDFINLITHSLEFNIDLILPANGNGWYKIDRKTFGKPSYVCFFPYAGTNRFQPQWNYIMEKLNYSIGNASDKHVFNMRYSKNKKKNPQYSLEYADQSIKEEVKHLDYFQYGSTHSWASLKTISNKKDDVNIVVLMRDPRDIANTAYWGKFRIFNLSESMMLKKALKGFVAFEDAFYPAYTYDFPSIEDITNAFLLASEAPNTFIIKFEDLISDPVSALKHLFSQLGLYPSIFCHLDDQIWQEATIKGSFAYQTKGKLHEGGHNSSYFMHTGHIHRKGIKGDWRSSFNQEAIDYVKKVTKGGLIKLGYEKDMNWILKEPH